MQLFKVNAEDRISLEKKRSKGCNINKNFDQTLEAFDILNKQILIIWLGNNTVLHDASLESSLLMLAM